MPEDQHIDYYVAGCDRWAGRAHGTSLYAVVVRVLDGLRSWQTSSQSMKLWVPDMPSLIPEDVKERILAELA